MKLTYPEINAVLDTENGKINSIVIENAELMYNFLSDINFQILGNDGRTVISDSKGTVDFAKSVELISQFIPFELSKKSLISKITSVMEKRAVAEDLYLETAELLSVFEKYLDKLSYEVDCDIIWEKVNINSLIKAAGIMLNEEYESLSEKILDYFELVREFERNKMFITVNLRSYISDNELELFLSDALKRNINLIMIENHEHKLLNNEKRLVIDSDLCEIEL